MFAFFTRRDRRLDALRRERARRDRISMLEDNARLLKERETLLSEQEALSKRVDILERKRQEREDARYEKSCRILARMAANQFNKPISEIKRMLEGQTPESINEAFDLLEANVDYDKFVKAVSKTPLDLSPSKEEEPQIKSPTSEIEGQEKLYSEFLQTFDFLEDSEFVELFGFLEKKKNRRYIEKRLRALAPRNKMMADNARMLKEQDDWLSEKKELTNRIEFLEREDQDERDVALQKFLYEKLPKMAANQFNKPISDVKKLLEDQTPEVIIEAFDLLEANVDYDEFVKGVS